MSNNKNKKKSKSKLSPEAAEKLRVGFGTIINNDCCIKAAREWGGAWNILPPFIAIISVLLAIIPSFVTNWRVEGKNYVFSGASYGYETGLMDFTHALAKSGIELEISQDGKLTYTSVEGLYSTWKDPLEAEPTLHKWYADINPSTGLPEFEVFFNANDEHSFTSDADFFAAIDANKNVDTGAYRSKAEDGTEMKLFEHSYIAFGKQSVRFRKRASTSLTTGTGLVGSYKKLAGFKLSSFIPKNEAGVEIGTIEGGGWAPSTQYVDIVVERYSKFMNTSFEDTKNALALQNAGVFMGIDAGIVLLFGLLLFLMTRGKKNPFRIYSFWDTTKIACWASFTPGVLSVALGFALTNYAVLIFMFTFGMRIMWMTMKSLRPAAQ